jgi:tetratricopeptide (TPR) repeat protein
MIRQWFNARDATEIGISLADQFVRQPTSGVSTPRTVEANGESGDLPQGILERADREVRTLRLNFYKKAKFANSFKWRLIENGVASQTASQITERLILHLAGNQLNSAANNTADAAPRARSRSKSAKYLFAEGNKRLAQGANAEAVVLFEELLRVDPRYAGALNNLGVALTRLGRHTEAERFFHRAIKVSPDFPDPYCNIGALLQSKGDFVRAESFLRQALKLNPRYLDARINLGFTLAALNRMREARAQIEKVLKIAPRNADALIGIAFVAKLEGRFDEANAMTCRALEVNPKLPGALASQAGMRKMTLADGNWLARAEEVASSGCAPLDQAELRFAIGKYYDDVKNFERAFQNYKRANELLKSSAEDYDRQAHVSYVDDMIRVYPRQTFARPEAGTSASMKPVFVVGMPRSGTSLTAQIIASHPSAKGAGELNYWGEAMIEHEAALRQGMLDESLRRKLAERYLRLLNDHLGDTLRVIDKAPVNSNYLGLIHSVFPNARIVYMQRDPIDTCLSCYFQKFATSLNFTMDLADLADYYRQHERLVAHWRAVLPPEIFLDVPYEELVANQEAWTRKILEFVGLEWDDRCLDFHQTNRAVATASFWQVRQKIFKDSVARWRNYERFIDPLLALHE